MSENNMELTKEKFIEEILTLNSNKYKKEGSI